MTNVDINTLSKEVNKQIQQQYQDPLYEIDLMESYRKFLIEQYRDKQWFREEPEQVRANIENVIKLCFDYGWTYGREFERNLHEHDE